MSDMGPIRGSVPTYEVGGMTMAYSEGERVHVRADFDDPNSAWQGTYELARDGERWVLR